MRKMKEELCFWDEIEGIGRLYTESELVVGFEPVLFVCTDKSKKEKFLIMTYDSCNGIYIMRKITNVELLNMLNNKVTMEETFRNSKNILKTYIDNDDVMRYDVFISSEFDESLLPRKGEYFELHSRYILNYIEKLENAKFSTNASYVDFSSYEIDSENTYYSMLLDSVALNTFSINYLHSCTYPAGIGQSRNNIMNSSVNNYLTI